MNLESRNRLRDQLQQLSPLGSTYVAGSVVDPDSVGSGSGRAKMTHKNWIYFSSNFFIFLVIKTPGQNSHEMLDPDRIQWIRIHNTDWLLDRKTPLILSFSTCRIVRRTTLRVRREEDQMRRIDPACPHPGTGSGIDQKTAAGPGLDRRRMGSGLGRTGSSSGSTGNDQWVSHSLKLGLMWLYVPIKYDSLMFITTVYDERYLPDHFLIISAWLENFIDLNFGMEGARYI